MGTKKKRLAALAVVGITALGGLALQVGTSGAGGVVARAELRNQANGVVGEVIFKKHGHEIVGIVEVNGLPTGTEFRGFHIHANDVDNYPSTTDGNPADGCISFNNTIETDDFVSVDGHWDNGTHSHGKHLGDLPVVMRDPNGHAEAEFTIGKFQPGDIIGRAVVVHVGADNYANIPTRYVSPTSPTGGGADPTTLGNGDAGARYACGVIVSSLDDGEDD